MFRLTRLTDYAIALLTHMVSDDKAIWAASDLSARSRLPQPTVSKILKHLAKTGIIKAVRGAAGGYQLSRAPNEITVVQIVEGMDGPICITDCSGVGKDSDCLIREFCVMGGSWNKINNAVRFALASVTLADMAGQGALKGTPGPLKADTSPICCQIEEAEKDLSLVIDESDEIVRRAAI
ncbi:MAG: SUF system Fe-S cluster assembly regulator [Bdellovibrionales bacterium]